MLKLNNITKIYAENTNNSVSALKGISLTFRPNEFVAILGQSGCGKTTLLNIIGGLDRYSDGDLMINNVSTKEYKDRDWDTYRNHSIGFVFQSYNLISHLTILENVELSLTIGGVNRTERRERAKKALISVGLVDKLTKKPNELSGGQMQRVSIARALVNEPDIILADEPTGALDSDTSVTVMDLLKEISKKKLVIMVTHNPDLANKYADRIIKMLDGQVTSDSNAYDDTQGQVIKADAEKSLVYTKKHSSMSFLTALKLSGKNLLSKFKRTIITCLAASIGIIGIAIILSLSNGMQNYIDTTMLDSAQFNYIMINSTSYDMTMLSQMQKEEELPEYPENTTGIIPYTVPLQQVKKQILSDEYLEYVKKNTDNLVIDIAYTYNVGLNILTKNEDKYLYVNSNNWTETLNNQEYLKDRYTVLAKNDEVVNGIPSEVTEIAIVVDKYNRLSTNILTSLGIEYTEDFQEISYDKLLNKEFRIVFNDGWYTVDSTSGMDIYRSANASNYEAAYNNDNGITLKVVSVLREKELSASTWLQTGVAYSPKLTELVLEKNQNSAVAVAQAASAEIDVTTGNAFLNVPSMMGMGKTYDSALEQLGYKHTPASILIYPTNVENREKIISSLDAWNTVKEDTDETVDYIDMSNVMTSLLDSVVNVVTYVLMAFSITSLVISSIMIAIIIYASVIERTKEIGVLRSIGARKKDVSHVFEAEALLLGIFSGVVAIVIAYGINIIINIIVEDLVNVSGIANLTIMISVSLILLSAFLLLIASLIPASIAAKKEPAVALRTE